jgi:hypothetical protein
MGNKRTRSDLGVVSNLAVDDGPAIDMALEDDRPSGRYITAKDLAQRLLGELHANEFLLWPPDLFAYTSYIMQKTAAYQLVVSPPSGKTWPPTKAELQEWICGGKPGDRFSWWLGEAKRDWLFKQELEKNLIATATKKVEEAIQSFSDNASEWAELVQDVGTEWGSLLNKLSAADFDVIDDNSESFEVREKWTHQEKKAHMRTRHKQLLRYTLEKTPALLLTCWAYFYHEVNFQNPHRSVLRISDLLCNQDHIQNEQKYCDRLWRASQALLTMHAIADIASLQFGIVAGTDDKPANTFAARLLSGRFKERPNIKTGGSLATLHTERCRILPKRHNPSVGITLRSISSNLAFHQSAVDVVWRKTADNNVLNQRFIGEHETENGKNITRKDARQLSILLLPFPLTIKTKDFSEDGATARKTSGVAHKFFSFEPHSDTGLNLETAREKEIDDAISLIKEANNELPDGLDVDLIVFPEAALSVTQFGYLEQQLDKELEEKAPSLIIAGVREARADLAKRIKAKAKQFNFARNAVYCKYMDLKKRTVHHGECYEPEGESEGIPKYIQYKHHRWRLDESQITRYGLSAVLPSEKMTWWESIKIPKRRVSFINVGDMMTISHLICEDLARQDPIADLVRHVGPTLVVTILLDGPQLKNRWSARYATVLADDPGSSVITLTSIGMVKRHSSGFGLMSRVVALWNESGGGHSREIELAQGAQAVLLTLTTVPDHEKTADGRQEQVPTTLLRLVDVIQVYPTNSSQT